MKVDFRHIVEIVESGFIEKTDIVRRMRKAALIEQV